MKGHGIENRGIKRAAPDWRRSFIGMAGAISVATACALACPALAQTGGGLPNTTIEPAGADASPSVPPGAPAVDEGAEGAEEGAPETATPAPTSARHHHHATARHHASDSAPVPPGIVEPARAKLRLKEDAWAYSRPSKSSKTVERVHAGKFIDVTGTTRYYLQVRLKSGATAYVPISAVDITKPTDKIFKLSADAAVVSEPSRYGKKLSEVHRGHDVHVIATSLNYLKIRMKDGLEGFIPMAAVE